MMINSEVKYSTLRDTVLISMVVERDKVESVFSITSRQNDEFIKIIIPYKEVDKLLYEEL